MSERWIWVVRLIGIIVFLVLMYLLMSLHARLVKMNEEQGGPAAFGDLRSRVVDCGLRDGPDRPRYDSSLVGPVTALRVNRTGSACGL